MTGNQQGGDATVEYRLLKGPDYVGQTINLNKNIFDVHDLKKGYFFNIATYFNTHGTDSP